MKECDCVEVTLICEHCGAIYPIELSERQTRFLKGKLIDRIHELESEVEKYRSVIKDAKKEPDSRICELERVHKRALCQIEHDRVKIEELINEIDCKRMELPPEEPIGAAEWLINAKRKRETNVIQREFHCAEDYEDYDAYSVSDLREIAEHLLAYCKNNESEVGTDVRN